MRMFPSPTDGLAGAPSAREGDPEFALRVIERLSVPTFALAADRRVLLWNKACEELTGVPAQEVLGTLSQWRAFYDKPRPCLAELVLARRFEDVALFYARGGRTAPGDDRVSAEDWCAMPKLDRPLYLAIEAAPIYDETGAMIAAVESLRDITAERRRQAELESLAALDGLTGLLNRRSFDERLAQEARRASRVNHPLALLMIDVDDFKPFNDAYGHQIGDACLRSGDPRRAFARRGRRGALRRRRIRCHPARRRQDRRPARRQAHSRTRRRASPRQSVFDHVAEAHAEHRRLRCGARLRRLGRAAGGALGLRTLSRQARGSGPHLDRRIRSGLDGARRAERDPARSAARARGLDLVTL